MINDEANYAPIIDEGDDKEADFRKYYHPAFCAAMGLELREDKEHLVFDAEYNLNTKPNRIDQLIINTVDDTKVKSGLGAIFKRHNLIEFKSFDDSLDERVYFRTLGYANLYIAYGASGIVPKDITLSFLRERYPRRLMNYFRAEGFVISKYEDGIYHIRKQGHMDMQVVVTRRLGEPYAWINKITKSLEPRDILQLQQEVSKLIDEEDLVNAESVIDMSITLNKDKDFVKEMIGMGALRDMFKKEFEEKDKKISDLSEQLQSKDEQLQSKDEQLQTKEEQLRLNREEISKLRKEVEEFRKNAGNKIAML